MTTAMEPISSSRLRSRSTCGPSNIPPPSHVPTQRAPPKVLKSSNRCQPMRVAPASGGAMVARPGTNFAISRAFTPQRSKRACVSLTQ